MTKFVAVLPFAYRPYYDEFMARCRLQESPDLDLLLIDNTDPKTNVGIMVSHNMGVERMYEVGADWLIIISAAIRFGEPGGLDFLEVLAAKDDHYIIHAASDNVAGGRQDDGTLGGGKNAVFGWHLTAFKREVFDNIGTWDENFSKYGLDDIDLSLRIQKHYKGRKTETGESGWNTYPIDVADSTMSHSISLAGVKSPYPPRAAYFTRKWLRTPEDWQSMGAENPFGDPAHDLKFWPRHDHPLSIHQVEFKMPEYAGGE